MTDRKRDPLPEGYQYLDAAKRPFCFHCGHLGHGWMRCEKLNKEIDAAMALAYADLMPYVYTTDRDHGDEA